MGKVYIVYKRWFRKAYNAEPYEMEQVMKVFDDYHKVINYICDAIKNDHEKLDDLGGDLTSVHKCVPYPDGFEEGYFIHSIDHTTNTYFETLTYRFISYDVE